MITTLKGFILKNDGPWGPINDDDRNKKPKNNEPNDDFEEIIKTLKSIFNNIFGDNKGGNKSQKKPKDNPPTKSIFGIIILGIVAFWLSTGFYKVNSDENAVVLYFGKFYSITTPGLRYRIPAPFSKVIKESVIKVNTEKFGFDSRSVNSGLSESLMLTGDENIVDIDFEIQWQISDIKDFTFNITDTKLALKKSAQSAMREVIARTPIAKALSDGKKNIEIEVETLLQEVLDSYGAGIRIVLVQLLRVDPPTKVIDSFRDVQTAKADKEKEINKAESFRNDIIPKARGEAEKLIQEAQAYKESVVSDAVGQASRFLAVYKQYARAKTVTKRRIYLETMEKIYENMDKIVVDKNISKSGVVPYLPLNELKKKND